MSFSSPSNRIGNSDRTTGKRCRGRTGSNRDGVGTGSYRICGSKLLNIASRRVISMNNRTGCHRNAVARDGKRHRVRVSADSNADSNTYGTGNGRVSPGKRITGRR